MPSQILWGRGYESVVNCVSWKKVQIEEMAAINTAANCQSSSVFAQQPLGKDVKS